MLKKALAVGAATALLAISGGSAFAASKSTQLSNGVLTVTAEDGCTVSGNCGLYYSATIYKKTGGDTKVTVQLALAADNWNIYDTQKTISKGQTVSKSWGGRAKADAGGCRVAGYMKASTGNYYTPTIDVC
ncbi:hypothetical protein ACFYU9_21465 [Streptomyces sp. NPDC004327]|uniref:hypothetical protein n=1 Tax=Streptomyces sp. NPDC004327 TaxID=3364699 RepID=UPI00368D79B3